MSLNEAIVEDAALTWFEELGYGIAQGPQIAPGEPAAERDSHGIVGDMLHGFDWSKWTKGKPVQRLALIPAGQEQHLHQKYPRSFKNPGKRRVFFSGQGRDRTGDTRIFRRFKNA